jgi:hypothetical protein
MTVTFMVQGEPTAHEDSEERSDKESGWGKAWIYQPPPRSLAEPALSGVEGFGMTPLLYGGRQTCINDQEEEGRR